MSCNQKPNGPNTIVGTTGSDFLFGGNGNDHIVSYDINYNGGPASRAAYYDGPDVIFGGNGNDTIDAGGDNDLLVGGRGNDVLNGNYGNDILIGGQGADTFVFGVQYASPGAPTFSGGVGAGNRDIIVDFRQGADHIDVRGYANLYFGVEGVDFVGRDAIEVSQKTQVGYHFEGGNTVVDIAFSPGPIQPGEDYTYNGPVAQIELFGHINLKASDFLLA